MAIGIGDSFGRLSAATVLLFPPDQFTLTDHGNGEAEVKLKDPIGPAPDFPVDRHEEKEPIGGIFPA